MRDLKFDLIYKGETRFHHKKYHLCELMVGIGEICDIHHQMDLIACRQSTGLKDKNGVGVDVFDGDIIKGKADLGGKLKRFIGAVNVDLPSVTVKGVKQYSWKTCQSIFDVRCFEVIGNIYENPELLK